MSTVRTVTGDIDSKEMGFTMAHEHVFMDLTGHGNADNEWSLYRWKEQLEAAQIYAADGGGTLIDANPRTHDGRDVARMKVLSEQTGVKVVACTGFVKDTPGFTNCQDLVNKSEDEIYEDYVREITEGIDGTDIKAGWVKGASMYMYISPMQLKCMRAGARAARDTGVPMHTHTEIGTYGLEQVEIIKSVGLDTEQFCCAHLDRNPDYWYHKKILDQGCYIIYDGPGKAKYYPDSVRVDLLKRLCADGYGDKIMLCNDMGKKSHHTVYGYGPGWCWIKDKFIPRLLDEGFSEEQCHKFMYDNPQRFYSIRK